MQVDLLPADHKGSPRILECLSYPISFRSSQARTHTGVSCIAGGFFTNWAIKKALQFRSVQSLSHVRLFVTPWTTAQQASLSSTNTQRLLKLMSNKSLMPSNYLILCRPLLLLPSIFPASGSFPVSQFFASGGQSIRASASVFPMNIQGWFPLGLTGLISLQSKGLPKVFSNTTESSPTPQSIPYIRRR